MSDYNVLSPRAVRAEFEDALQVYDLQASYAKVGELTKSDTDLERYPFFGQVPTLAEHQGEFRAGRLRSKSITVVNAEYSAALELPDKWLRRDSKGQLQKKANGFGEAQGVHWLELYSTSIVDGESGLAFDGAAYFSASHAWGDSGTHSNLLSIDISAAPVSAHGPSTDEPSVQEFAYCMMRAIRQILGAKSDRGKAMNTMARHFLFQVPTKYWDKAQMAVALMTLGSGEANPLANLATRGFTIEVEINPELDASFTASFWCARVDGPTKALILQSEILAGAGDLGVQIEVLGIGSEYWKVHHHTLVTAYASRGVAYGDYRQACKVTMA